MNPIVTLWESDDKEYRVSLNLNAMYIVERSVGSTQRHIIGIYDRLTETFAYTNAYERLLSDPKVNLTFKNNVILHHSLI